MNDFENVDIENKTDGNNNPTGGVVNGEGIWLRWQDGPMEGGKPNGAHIETVLAICKNRLAFFQTSKFKCLENQKAIAAIELAMHHLERRTTDRVARGVEGTYDV